MQQIRWFFRKVWQFFKWLVVRWHVSFTAFAFYWVAIRHTKDNPDLMVSFVEANLGYFVAGVYIELIIRRRHLLPSRATIPKQSERT